MAPHAQLSNHKQAREPAAHHSCAKQDDSADSGVGRRQVNEVQGIPVASCIDARPCQPHDEYLYNGVSGVVVYVNFATRERTFVTSNFTSQGSLLGETAMRRFCMSTTEQCF